MEKIRAIHSFIPAMQHVLESHDLKGALLTFDYAQRIIISYCDFVSPFKTPVYFIDYSMRYSQFKSHVTRVATPIFSHTHLNIFLSTLNF